VSDVMEKIENTNISGWLRLLEKARSGSKNPKKLTYLIRLASKPKRARASINLSRLDKLVKENDSVIVPGKVLGSGSMSKRISISAISFSGSAEQKLRGSKCSVVGIEEMLNDKNARIII
jgi:large subunit ribosomal protein L18e